jgi:hypothetical protein
MHFFLSSITVTIETCWLYVLAGGSIWPTYLARMLRSRLLLKGTTVYRVIAERKKLAQIVATRINEIDYGNFKDSVENDGLHALYGQFWTLHHQYQR